MGEINKPNVGIVTAQYELSILASLLKDPSLLKKTKYHFEPEDFSGDGKAIYNAIDKLSKTEGATIDAATVRVEMQAAPFGMSASAEKLLKDLTNDEFRLAGKNFDLYYDRIKKQRVIRDYNALGLYLPEQKAASLSFDNGDQGPLVSYIDKHSISELIDVFESQFDPIKKHYRYNDMQKAKRLGDYVDEFMKTISEEPEVGLPMPFGMYNNITGGARFGRLYLCSADTGIGKTRNMVGFMAHTACSRFWGKDGWVENKFQRPCLYISTELDLDEIIALFLAFISGVSSSTISGRGKEPINFAASERLQEAARILKEAPIYYEVLMDFTSEKIENTIKFNIEENHIEYIAFDYIHTSMSIIQEVAEKTRGQNVREDEILFMLAMQLKNIALKYNVFIMTATQVNRSINSGAEISAAMLRGSSAIADKVDLAEILTRPTQEQIDKLNAVSEQSITGINLIRNIFKNRGNEYVNVKVWCAADLGTCKIVPMIVTDSAITRTIKPEGPYQTIGTYDIALDEHRTQSLINSFEKRKAKDA